MSLRLENVSKSFPPSLKILDGLDLKLEDGEILAIVGSSGSGKSTLLSVIAGFARPDQGRLFCLDDESTDWNDSQWSDFRKRGLGFVFQNYHLIPYLTAEENVALPLRLLKDESPRVKAKDLLARLGLENRADHLPGALSGGEKQRVAIARALIHQPSLVLADEPTGSLDVKTGDQVLNVLFGALKEQRQTALIVTHAPEVAARCDRVLTLKQGRLWPA